MKVSYFILISLLLFSCQSHVKKSNNRFDVTTYDLTNENDYHAFKKWKRLNILLEESFTHQLLFHHDTQPIAELHSSFKDYQVFSNCMGEFGGSLLFQEKGIKDSIYYLKSTCPLMVDKKFNGYYITETSSHLEGSGRILFIHSPKDLVKLPVDSLYPNWENETIKRISKRSNRDFTTVMLEVSDSLKNQGEILLDTTGIIFNIFIPSKEFSSLIFTDLHGTYVGQLKDKRLIKIDTITDIPTWSNQEKPTIINNGLYCYSFKNRGSDFISNQSNRNKPITGNIFVKSDSIIIAYRYDK